MLPLIFLSALLAVPTVLTSPYQLGGCSLAEANLTTILANQTTLAIPTIPPSSVSLGVGVQNYTCGSTGTYTSTGAVAELYDLSCLVNTPIFESTPSIAFDLWIKAPTFATAQEMIDALATVSFGPVPDIVLGQHYFVPNPFGTGLSPKWDYTSSGVTKGNADAFVIGARDASLNAPSPATDVPWLQLHGVQGKLATSIYRVLTRGGQPPTTCTPGTPDISVKYTSQYWLFGSTL